MAFESEQEGNSRKIQSNVCIYVLAVSRIALQLASTNLVHGTLNTRSTSRGVCGRYHYDMMVSMDIYSTSKVRTA